MMKQRILFFAVIIFVFLLAHAGSAEEPARVEVFSPQGVVKTVRQVSARFSEQMVAFGDPRAEDPFEITCPEKGRSRWADSSTWIYDYDRDLPAGVVCEFTMKKDLKTASGFSLGGTQAFSFSTGGPAILRVYPGQAPEEIAEDQIFVLELDAETDEASAAAHVSCEIDGIHERVGIRIVKGEERKKILAQYRFLQNEHSMLLQCRQKFPAKSSVRLVWGKGVSTPGGVKTTEDQVFTFKARGPFTAQFTCDRENAHANCIPVLPLRLRFTAPVLWDSARKIVLRGGGRVYKPEKSAEVDSQADGQVDDSGEDGGDNTAGSQQVLDEKFVSAVSFKGPFPENGSFVIELPKDLRDDAGRTLVNRSSFPLAVKTSAYPPLAKFSARFGIIELKADPMLPVTIRNIEPAVKTRMLKVERPLEGTIEKAKDGALDKAARLGESLGSILPGTLKEKNQSMVDGLKGRLHKIRMGSEEQVIDWLKKVASARRDHPVLVNGKNTREFSVPKPAGARSFEVVGLPLKDPGFYIVEIESRILGSALLEKQGPMFVPTAALVTNLSAHFKWGRESSLVWVTTLDKGEPVRDAAVSVRDCTAKVLWEGKTDQNGVASITKNLKSDEDLPSCETKINFEEASHELGGINRGLFVFAKTVTDMTFVHSSWEKGIEPWRYALPYADERTSIAAHTIFDRSLLRAGETVHMKHILRRRSMTGFVVPPASALPQAVLFRHVGSEQSYEIPLVWGRNGAAETAWQIPKDAKLGQYSVTLLKKSSRNKKQKGQETSSYPEGWESGQFRVEEFRLPLMKAVVQQPKAPLVNTTEATVDLYVSYLSGGGAKNARIKLRSQTQAKTVHFNDYDDFVFANGEVKEEKIRRSRSYESDGQEEIKKQQIQAQELVLDNNGGLRATIAGLPRTQQPQDILAEIEFRDPNGEIQTVSQRIPLWPSGLLTGIKPDSWTLSKDDLRFQVIVLDLAGKPVAGRGVSVDLFQKKSYSHRKRLVGGFYAYEHSAETKKLGKVCEGKTDGRGLLFCSVKSPASGNIVLQAAAIDDGGNRSVSHHDVWIAGKGEWWFDVSDHDRIDLVPEKKKYEPGDTAKLQVRMPFRDATALITVEREGIIDTYVRTLSGKQPVIEIPVKGRYAPNIFVSALVVRGRVAGVQPTALVDLGKPAFKLGLAEISVGAKAFELKVAVNAEKDVYPVRGKARVKIKVRRADGKLLPKGSEVAIAAVDEGLLELMPNRSWKVLEAMMGRRGYEVHTATAQLQVVGKRHYGLKAQPQGGGGGRQTTRELFDTLLLWKAKVKLNEKGEAEVSIPLNDSLTSFRIVAVATGGANLFGTGQTSIRTSQDLMVLAGLPQVVREGDRFSAGFTVRNTSARNMEVDVKAVLGSPEKKELKGVTVSVAAGDSQVVAWDIKVPYGASSLTYEVVASEKGGGGSDSVTVKQRVAEAVPVRTFQATLTRINQPVDSQVNQPYILDVERPHDAIAGKGGLAMSFRPRISDSLGGVATYMKQYPYTCMEQRVSRAVSLRDEALWKNVVAALPSHIDSEGLVKYFPSMTYGSDVLTAYILSIAHEAGWAIPQDVRDRMEEGLTGFIAGKVVRYSSVPTADLSIRKLAAVEALSRTGKAEPAMLASIAIEPNLWPTSAVLDWMGLLLRMKGIPEQEKRVQQAGQILRSRINVQGTTLGFSSERTDQLWWLMVSVDLNAVKSILTLLDLGDWKQDIPRMAQGALGRQKHGAWGLTTANAWGVLAFEKFSKKFESIPVSGVTSVSLGSSNQKNGGPDEHEKAIDWGRNPEGQSLKFSWPKAKERLMIQHQGSGSPWVTVQSLAALPFKEPLSSGYRIKKTLTPIEQKTAGRWTKGDVVRVKLEIEAQSDMTWVVASDPIPAGSMILGSGLGRDSQIMTGDEKKEGRVWPAFEERSFEAFRSYYEYVPKGAWTIEYTVRLNNSGTFHLPPSRVEAMYAPEMFGEIPNKAVEVGP